MSSLQLEIFIGIMLTISLLSNIVDRRTRNDNVAITFAFINIISVIIVVIGVLYWLTQKVQPINTLSGNITVYVALAVSLILLFQAARKIRWKSFVDKSVVNKTRNLLAIIIVLSGFLYWHISLIEPRLSKFDAWLTGLDIILAHMAITIPMFQWFYYTIKRIFRRSFFFPGVDSIISFLVSFWLVWLLLIKTTNLQISLFGSYNTTLGWDLPTSYKFSILFEQLQKLFGNQILATIIGFVVFATSIALSYTSILSSIITIRESSK